MPERAERTLHVSDARVSPPPPGAQPIIPAEQAWTSLRMGRLPVGGGGDERLVFGIFTFKNRSPVLAWALYTRHSAQPLNQQPLPKNVKPLPDAEPCFFGTTLDGLDATSGNRFGGAITSE
ncbi:MAG: hypothetical protein M3137_11395 [Actinomycetota bacterium]|nr:hypothetical protein [Actinomycetota bacterium]